MILNQIVSYFQRISPQPTNGGKVERQLEAKIEKVKKSTSSQYGQSMRKLDRLQQQLEGLELLVIEVKGNHNV